MSKLFIISGLPSTGSGKDSVIDGLEKELDFTRIITTTTRPKRPGEKQDWPYHFVSIAEFKKMAANNEFLEWAEVYGNYYGNSKKEMTRALQGDKPVILRIDCQGVRTYKKLIPEAVVILITVPSLEILATRLRRRGQDSEQVIQSRLNEAKKELDNPPPFEYLIANEEDKLEKTVRKVKEIILKESGR